MGLSIFAGNVGIALMRGMAMLSPLGEGLQDENNAAGQSIKVQGLEVHNGLLYVCGGFSYAGHVPAERIATWDGTEWCSIGGSFGDAVVTSMAFYNDTLYIGAGLDAVISGVPNRFANLRGLLMRQL